MLGKATHVHDCEKCVYLGTTIAGGRITDMYVHAGQFMTTVIARYGREEDYYSCSIRHVRPTGHAELFLAACLYYKGELPNELLVHLRG